MHPGRTAAPAFPSPLAVRAAYLSARLTGTSVSSGVESAKPEPERT